MCISHERRIVTIDQLLFIGPNLTPNKTTSLNGPCYPPLVGSVYRRKNFSWMILNRQPLTTTKYLDVHLSPPPELAMWSLAHLLWLFEGGPPNPKGMAFHWYSWVIFLTYHGHFWAWIGGGFSWKSALGLYSCLHYPISWLALYLVPWSILYWPLALGLAPHGKSRFWLCGLTSPTPYTSLPFHSC